MWIRNRISVYPKSWQQCGDLICEILIAAYSALYIELQRCIPTIGESSFKTCTVHGQTFFVGYWNVYCTEIKGILQLVHVSLKIFVHVHCVLLPSHFVIISAVLSVHQSLLLLYTTCINKMNTKYSSIFFPVLWNWGQGLKNIGKISHKTRILGNFSFQ